MINIIGLGYVGKSISYLCDVNNIKYNVYDIIEKKGNFIYYQNIKNLINNTEKSHDINYYFICVPTPSLSSGKCDTSIVEHCIREIIFSITKTSYIIIKSTLEPGTCEHLYNKYFINNQISNLILNPEFLRESTYKDDVYNPGFLLLGVSNTTNLQRLQEVYKMFRTTLYKHNTMIDILTKTYTECEIYKYTLNSYLAVKIIYFNEIYELCNKLNTNYNNVKTLFQLDSRIGEYGIHVPAHDNYMGHGKSCLQKDLSGMVELRRSLNLDYNILNNVKLRNLEFRKIKVD